MINKKIVIEIRGVNPLNKGAELMLSATKQRILREFGEDAVIVLGVGPGNTPEYARHHGMVRTSTVQKKFLQYDFPERPGRTIHPSKIDVVLDASGFAYGDVWGIQESFVLWAYSNRIRKYNSNVVFIALPQAFGRFDGFLLSKIFHRALMNFDLVYPRDETSRNELCKLSPKFDFRKVPDMTIGYCADGKNSPIGIVGDYVVLVPNSKVIEKGSKYDESTYLNQLKLIGDKFLENGIQLKLLVHDGGRDAALAHKLACNQGFEVIVELTDPDEIKHVIGGAYALIGSRFHSLVSALSQDIPVIGLGWSHKYDELLRDFNMSKYLISDQLVGAVLTQFIDAFITDHPLLRSEISVKRREHQLIVEKMWAEVFSLIKGRKS